MKKLVTTPLTRTIYWATVNDAKGMITGEKKDVTDNAVQCVLDHFIYSSDFNEKGFTGYNGRMDKKSTGIGLYLCKQVMDNLGLEIKVSSWVGQGTCFRIDFNQLLYNNTKIVMD